MPVGDKIAHAESALRAAQALIVGSKPGERRRWIEAERRWKSRIKQLRKEI